MPLSLSAVKLRIDQGEHRQATWLELLFDLVLVICIAALAHGLMETPTSTGLLVFVGLLVPVWWVWNQFTWYASHFDNDDIVFRSLMLWGVTGTLFLSRGIHGVSHGHPAAFVSAYLFLHGALALGWLRAHRHIPEYRSYSRLKLIGIALGLLFWSASLMAPPALQVVLLGVGTVLQLAMPVLAWATVKKMISVHHHHLQERHGLFVIILLGECLVALAGNLPELHGVSDVLQVLFPLLTVFGIWWIYFDWKYDPVSLKVTGYAFAYNYGHLFVLGGLGLLAAGIGLGPNPSGGFVGPKWMTAGAAVFLTALFVMNWLSHRERNQRLRGWGLGVAAALSVSLFLPLDFSGLARPGFLTLMILLLVCVGEGRKALMTEPR